LCFTIERCRIQIIQLTERHFYIQALHLTLFPHVQTMKKTGLGTCEELHDLYPNRR
jgi:hypothetical protein